MILLFLWHIPSRDHPHRHDPGRGAARVHPDVAAWASTSNIMSLAGIAISIGVLVDGAIVEVENAYKKLEQWEAGGRQGDFHEVRLDGAPGGRARRSSSRCS